MYGVFTSPKMQYVTSSHNHGVEFCHGHVFTFLNIPQVCDCNMSSSVTSCLEEEKMEREQSYGSHVVALHVLNTNLDHCVKRK